jgi:hypothetical protein
MFACGINGPLELIEKGENKNCRVYSVKDRQYVPNCSSIYTSLTPIQDTIRGLCGNLTCR